MKKILIVGSEGYIGSSLLFYLKRYKNYKITTLDTGYFRDGVLKKNLKNKLNYNIDIRKFNYKKIKDFNIVICLAGQQNDPGNFSKKKFYKITKKYTLQLAKNCKKYGVKFIFPSSCSVYGYSSKFVNEKSKFNPITYYSKSKIEIEKELKKISDKKFFPIILRFSTIFGFSNAFRMDLLINMICTMAVYNGRIILNSNGKSWRPYLHVDFACRAIKLCIDKKFNFNDPQIYNVGFNSYNYKTIDVAKLVKKITGAKIIFELNSGKANFKADKIVKGGVDKRSYRVNFNLFHKTFPKFNKNNNLEEDILILVKKIKKFKNYNKNLINDYRYFRLQKMEKLIKNKLVNRDLYWKKK